VTTLGQVPRQEPQPHNDVVPLRHPGPPAPHFTLGLLARSACPRQWLKDLLVFMAPAAAGVLGEWHMTLRVVAAFLIFCVVASGTYLINDCVDAEADRYHPTKRVQPVASGALRPGVVGARGTDIPITPDVRLSSAHRS
jgi:decaprenyl-phosphate phosphoribosyltransferase